MSDLFEQQLPTERNIPQAAKDRPPTQVQHARERYNLPIGWMWFQMKALGTHPNYIGALLTGAVCEAVYLRGKCKGQKNWSKRDRATEVMVPIMDADHKAWLGQWEADTGLCAQCHGSGLRWHGWSALHGTRYAPCDKCGATGQAVRAAA